MKAYFFIILALLAGAAANAEVSSDSFKALFTPSNLGVEVPYKDIYQTLGFADFDRTKGEVGQWTQRESYIFPDKDHYQLEQKVRAEILSKEITRNPGVPDIAHYEVKLQIQKMVNGQLESSESVIDLYVTGPISPWSSLGLMKPAPGGSEKKYYGLQVNSHRDTLPGKVKNQPDCGGLPGCSLPSKQVFFQSLHFVNGVAEKRFLHDFEVSEFLPSLSTGYSKECVWEVELNNPWSYQSGRCEYLTDFHF